MNIPRHIVLLAIACTSLLACARQSTDPSVVDESPSVSVLVFGDSGYDIRYQEQKYFDKPLPTREAFADAHREWWKKHHRVPEDFSVPPSDYHAESGSYVPRSGLIRAAAEMQRSCELESCDKFYMDGFFYTVEPSAAAGTVEIFAVDTEILLSSTDVRKAVLNADGTEHALVQIVWGAAAKLHDVHRC